jgi:hypothetical protein
LQREVIAALGYTLYQAQGSAPAMAVDAQPLETAQDEPRHGDSGRGDAGRGEARQVRAQPAGGRAGASESALLRALLKAAGTDASASEAVALCQGWISSTSPLADAAARRALWPRLRSLRGRRLS